MQWKKDKIVNNLHLFSRGRLAARPNVVIFVLVLDEKSLSKNDSRYFHYQYFGSILRILVLSLCQSLIYLSPSFLWHVFDRVCVFHQSTLPIDATIQGQINHEV